MSAPSKWPLPENGIRFLTPAFMRKKLARHPLTRECYPTAMGFYPRAEKHRMQRQRHDDNLLIYCVEGRGIASTAGWRGEIGAGDALLLPQGTTHHYEADNDEPWSIYWVHYQGTSTAVFNQYLGDREGGRASAAGRGIASAGSALSGPAGRAAHRVQQPRFHQRGQPAAPPAHPYRPGYAAGQRCAA